MCVSDCAPSFDDCAFFVNGSSAMIEGATPASGGDSDFVLGWVSLPVVVLVVNDILCDSLSLMIYENTSFQFSVFRVFDRLTIVTNQSSTLFAVLLTKC